jgi:hypothetical protein
MRKILLFELNEVPYRILEEYCRRRSGSTFAKIMPSCYKYQTLTEDKSHLSPWVTWPSLHRGVHDEKHGIMNFGQDLRVVDERYPPIWRILASHGVKTGVFGSLHTYPLPERLDGYAFFVPDTFAKGAETFPERIQTFQDFNLTLARASARNVSTVVPWKLALRLLASSPALGLRTVTYADVGGQLLNERLKPERRTRRRVYQSVLAFDVFMKCLTDTRPEFATFFTNHVASSMHRYWAAAFPGDYAQFEYDSEWARRFGSEIFFAMDKADAFLGSLKRFADSNDYVVCVASSMGQAATRAVPLNTQLYVTDPGKFMNALGFGASTWSLVPAMLPQFNVRLEAAHVEKFQAALESIELSQKQLVYRLEQNGFFSIDFGHTNLDSSSTFVVNGKERDYAAFGLENVQIEDMTGSNAYHIPEGMLLVYDPGNLEAKSERTPISTLDIAPTILRNFDVPIPSYMKPVRSLGAF